MIPQWYPVTIPEGSPLRVMARVYDVDDAVITQAGISAISYRSVENGDTASPVIGNTALTVSAVVFDTLQTTSNDAAWENHDATGYNFKVILPGTCFPNGGTTNHVPITFTDTSGYTWTGILIVATVLETYLD